MSAIPFTRLGRISLGLLLGAPLAAKAQSVHAVLPVPPAIDDLRLLRAIAAVETGTTDLSRPCRKIGKAGERSAFQIKASVWKQYTTLPHAVASTDARMAHLVAALHLQQLKAQAERNMWCASAHNVAYLWNKSAKAFQYAQRVAALYDDPSCPPLITFLKP
jgi:hypothetical protein